MDHLSDSASLVMALGLGAVVLCIVLVICWIVLPFAVIGTKPLLRELIVQQKETNRLLAAQTQALDALARRGATSPPL